MPKTGLDIPSTFGPLGVNLDLCYSIHSSSPDIQIIILSLLLVVSATLIAPIC
jgi:hypothetical protein